MNIEYLSAVVSMLVVLSIASERLVEIIKGFVPFLNEEQEENLHEDKLNPKRERIRKACLQLLAVVSGIVTALLTREAIVGIVPDRFNTTSGIIALGLLASGGSGLWNSILGYANEAKKIKRKERENHQSHD
jgi:hypothetical protein